MEILYIKTVGYCCIGILKEKLITLSVYVKK